MVTKNRHYRDFEVRAVDNSEGMNIEGYAVVFDEETVLYEYDGIEYKESISKEAFKDTKMSDVVLNYNHGGKPFSRTKNGTLALSIDDYGLKVKADLSGTEEGRKTYEEVKGGYLDKMSFSFIANKQEYDREKHLRRITGIKRLFDVSIVDFPAYDNTSVSARSQEAVTFFEAEAEKEKAEAILVEERNKRKRRLELKIKMMEEN